MTGYLIDMDGVIYRGNELIPGADRFIADLRSRNIPFVFLTMVILSQTNPLIRYFKRFRGEEEEKKRGQAT